MKPKLAIALLAIAGSALATQAVADISRGCNARYDLVYLLVDGGKFTSEKRLSFGHFTSRGMCRSRVYANDCRREARDLAHSCMKEHWKWRWGIAVSEGGRKQRIKPGQCHRQRANMGPQDYTLDDLKTAIEATVCCSAGAPSFNNYARVRLEGHTSGDKRCGKGSLLSETYTVTPEMCAAVDSKICGH